MSSPRTKHGWVLGGDGTYRPDTTSSESASCSGPGVCADCTQEAASIAFRGQQAQEGATVTCPTCSTTFVPAEQPVRLTESVAAGEETSPPRNPPTEPEGEQSVEAWYHPISGDPARGLCGTTVLCFDCGPRTPGFHGPVQVSGVEASRACSGCGWPLIKRPIDARETEAPAG